MKAKDYKFLAFANADTVEKGVCQLLEKGWQLLGAPTAGNGVYSQGLYLPADLEGPKRIAYVQGRTVGEITIKVEERLSEGWTPVGGLTVAVVSGEASYYQMMSSHAESPSTPQGNE